MIKVRHESVIHKPVEDVFAFVTDVKHYSEWVTGAVSNKITSDGLFGLGSTFHQVGEFMGKQFEMEITVTHFDPDRRYSYKSLTGPVPFEQHYQFLPEGEDTRVTVVVMGETKGFLSAFSGVATRVYKMNLENDLEKLEEILAGK